MEFAGRSKYKNQSFSSFCKNAVYLAFLVFVSFSIAAEPSSGTKPGPGNPPSSGTPKPSAPSPVSSRDDEEVPDYLKLTPDGQMGNFEIPDPYHVDPSMQFNAKDGSPRLPDVRIGPIYNGLLMGLLGIMDLDKRDGARITTEDRQRYAKFVTWLKLLHDVYAERRTSVEGYIDGNKIKDIHHAVYALEPLRPRGLNVTEGVDDALRLWALGQLARALSDKIGPDQFANARARSATEAFLSQRKERIEALLDIHSKRSSIVGDVLYSVLRSLVVSVVSSTRGLQTGAKGASGALREFADFLEDRETAPDAEKAAPVAGDRFTSMRNTADRLEQFAEGVDQLHDRFSSEEGLLTIVEKMLKLNAESPRAMRDFFFQLERDVSKILSDKLRELPSKLAKNSTFADAVDASHAKSENNVREILNLIFVEYLPRLPLSVRRNIYFDLLTADPNLPDSEVLSLLVRRFLPIMTNVMQHMAVHSPSESVRAVGKELTDSGLRDAPYTALKTLHEDPAGFRVVYVEASPDNMRAAVEEGEFSVTKKLYNFDPYAINAGKVMQVHTAYIVKDGKFVKVAVRIPKKSTIALIDAELQALRSIVPRLSEVMKSEDGTSAQKSMVEAFVENIRRLIGMELDPKIANANHETARVRFADKRSVVIDGREVDVELRTPEVIFHSDASPLMISEFIDSVSFSRMQKDHPAATRALGQTIVHKMEDESFWSQLSRHPMLDKTIEYCKKNNMTLNPITLEVTNKEGHVLSADELLAFTVNISKEFAYPDSDNSLGKHLQNIRNARLDVGIMHGDPHIGNYLFLMPTQDSGRTSATAYVIDLGILATLEKAHLPGVVKSMAGLEMGDESMLVEGLYDLALKDEIKDLKGFRAEILGAVKGLQREGVPMVIGSIVYHLALYKKIPFPMDLFALHQPADTLERFHRETGNSPAALKSRREALVTQHEATIAKHANIGLWKGASYKFRSMCIKALGGKAANATN